MSRRVGVLSITGSLLLPLTGSTPFAPLFFGASRRVGGCVVTPCDRTIGAPRPPGLPFAPFAFGASRFVRPRSRRVGGGSPWLRGVTTGPRFNSPFAFGASRHFQRIRLNRLKKPFTDQGNVRPRPR